MTRVDPGNVEQPSHRPRHRSTRPGGAESDLPGVVSDRYQGLPLYAQPSDSTGPRGICARLPAEALADQARGPGDGPALPVGRAGRNLPAAIAVSAGLAGMVVVSLWWYKIAFFCVVFAAAGIGVWEMARAMRSAGRRPPLPPLLLGSGAMIWLAWQGGVEALPYGLLGAVVAIVMWRLAEGAAGYQRDVTAAVLIAVYVPFLAGFAVLLAVPADGHVRVLTMIALVVLSDTGGYAVGVWLGRHPMAPTISPKKSWEGFAGSLIAAMTGGAILMPIIWDMEWWRGLLLGLATAIAAVLGDLTESMLKRDLGVKDMSGLLPGHGGLMDRLDSILFAAPTAFVMLSLLTPPGG